MENTIDNNSDYYKILQIQYNATVDDVKKAYKRLVLAFHPDVNRETYDDEKFKEIVKAYSVLKDRELKAEYDKMLAGSQIRPQKINFKYCYHEFIKKGNDLVNIFKIIFKNITGIASPDENKNNAYQAIDEPVSVSEDIINMPSDELEQRLEYSDNVYVRINACFAMGLKKEKRSFTVLEKIVTTDEDAEVKKAAIWAIGNLRMKKPLNFLKILFLSGNSILKLDILKAVYKITEGRGNFFNEILVDSLNDGNNETKIGAFDFFLKTNKKIQFKDIKGLINNSSLETRPFLEKLIHEKRIIDYAGEN